MVTSSCSRPRRDSEKGFTLLELIVAMTVFGLIGLGIFGVLVLGARSAGSGERVTEQARRYRVANDVITRQIAAAEPMQLPRQKDKGLSEDDDEGGNEAEPYFFGDAETLEFVTTAAQRPDASGMAIVNYWLEDGMLKMSERPVFTAYGTGKKLDRDKEQDTVDTVLLYDVASVTFSYQRESDTDEWLDTWDATDESQVPACVRIDVKPSAAGGPDFYHEIPTMVGTFNQINGVDEDFGPHKASHSSPDDDDGSNNNQQVQPNPNKDETPGATLPGAGDDDNDNDDDSDE
jgi:general secretion pathway protein J